MYGILKSKSKLYYDRRSVGQSVFVSGTHLGPRPIFPLLSLITFRQLRVCRCGAPSLTIGRVCNLQCNEASSSYIATDGLSISSSETIARETCLCYIGAVLLTLRKRVCLATTSSTSSPILAFSHHNILIGDGFQVYLTFDRSGEQIVILATIRWWQKLG
jgi:hypothetical protein